MADIYVAGTYGDTMVVSIGLSYRGSKFSLSERIKGQF